MPTPLALASWTSDDTQKLRVDVDLTGTLSLDVTPTAPPTDLDTEGPDIVHFDFDGDLVLDANGRPT